MKGRDLLAAAVAAAVAAAAGGATANGSAGAAGEQTVRLVERPATFRFLDNAPRARKGRVSAGDASVMTSGLTDAGGTRVGSLYLECTAVRDGRPERTPFHCTGDYQLRDGTLSVDAIIVGGGPIAFALTGGTGAYAGRMGTAVATPRSRGRLLDHTLHLSAMS